MKRLFGQVCPNGRLRLLHKRLTILQLRCGKAVGKPIQGRVNRPDNRHQGF
jgi:hypothetical protein